MVYRLVEDIAESDEGKENVAVIPPIRASHCKCQEGPLDLFSQ